MQRSGTTLLRRLFTIHPQVRRVFHESFFVSKFRDAKALSTHVNHKGLNPKKNIWGEKCPYYPNIRKIKPEVYCDTLHKWYPKKFKVVHIIRHPIDIANSNVKKFNYIRDINQPLRMYNKIIPRIVTSFEERPFIIQIKYEHLLQAPDEVLSKIYSFCNLKPDIDFRSRLKQLKNPKYQQIDPSRSFAFMESEQRLKINFDEVFKLLDKIEGPKY